MEYLSQEEIQNLLRDLCGDVWFEEEDEGRNGGTGMKEIEVVIKIPEDIMMRVSMGMKNEGDTDVVDVALSNGVVLPDQHGDLIDRDALNEKFCDYVTSGYANNADDCSEYSMMLMQAPTVLAGVEDSDV